MNWLRDTSIGTRITAGFAIVIALLAAFAIVTLVSHQRSSAAQAEHAQRILPRAQRAVDLERTVFEVAIAWRDWLISGDSEHADAAHRAIERARQALAASARHPNGPEGAHLFDAVEASVQRYLAEATNTVRTGRVANPAAIEDALTRGRREAVAAIRAYSDLQRERGRHAIAAMEASREAVGTALVLTFVTIAIVLVLLGWWLTVSIRSPARELTQVAKQMQAGDWHAALELAPAAARARGENMSPANELERISLAFGAAAEALEHREQRLRADARIAKASTVSLDRSAVAEHALAAMAEHIGAPVGVVYWREQDGVTLRPIATRALPADADVLKLGEGLPGLAAGEGRLMVVNDIPADSPLRLRTGIDDIAPRAIVAVPAILRRELHGVVVLASPRSLDARALDFLEAAGLQLAIGLANARAHENMRRLLDQLREAQERLQAQNEELQAQSEELQAQNEEIQVQTEELQRNSAELAEADGRKNEFIGLLAHELRNPLAAIANGVYILGQGTARTDNESRILELIRRQMGYLTHLIDDLLDVSRIAHGKLQLDREVLDLCELVHHSVNDMRGAAAQAKVSLEAHVPPAALAVRGDRTRLAQVLGNLIGNAIKFTPEGGRIEVHLQRHAEAKAVIVVRDTGVGIEPAMLGKLFHPFSQGQAPHARPNGGLGLGLALSKALVELHEGAIEARSDGAGRGAAFIVTLPLSHERPSAASQPGTGGYRAARRILLIEDNEDAAEALQAALRLKGHAVEIARTGLEGVEKAREMIPDLVLCDLAIPGIDGYEVARRLRADARLSATPLIALSGYATAQDQERSRNAGFREHLAKPVAMEKLLEVIARFAGHAQASDGVTA